MSVITEKIGERAFIKIRDRIANILIDEMENQAAISYDDDLIVKHFLERGTALHHTEVEAINVMVARGDFDLQSALQKEGGYLYAVDCYAKSKNKQSGTEIIPGDYLANLKVQKIMSYVDAIIMDGRYDLLGFEPPFIAHREVVDLAMRSNQEVEDGVVVAMGRVTILVRAVEVSEEKELKLIEGYDTKVHIEDTEQGYFYSGGQEP